MYISRAMEPTITELSGQFKALLLTGPRQVGKTTLLKTLMGKERRYVSLDDPAARLLAKSDPPLFLSRFPAPVLIDEVQYAPEILPYIKMAVDAGDEKGRYWLTGSQLFHSMKNVGESLAGRVAVVNLPGLSNKELDGGVSEPFRTDAEFFMRRMGNAPCLGIGDVYQRIFRGGMPELAANPKTDRDAYYSSYVNTYIERDIRNLTQVADETAFLRFMMVVAANTAKPLQYQDLANEAGISAPTAKKWLSVLASSCLVALVQPFHHNVLRRAVKMPLLHFLDTGLCAYLTGWTDPTVLERGAMAGQIFESWAFGEIYKSYVNAGKKPPLYYYRDKDKKEIDLLIYENGMVCPIEIKKTSSPGRNDMKNFAALDPFREMGNDLKIEVGPGIVLCMAKEPMPVNQNNWFVPVSVV